MMGSVFSESQLRDLEKRIQHLEYRVKLLAEIADFEKHPFIYSILESNLTEKQVKGIFELMDKTLKAIRNEKSINHYQFEEKLYKIVPSHRGDYHFAESIISTLNDEGRWVEVYKYMKKNGMNM